MNVLLLATIARVIIHLLIALTGLVAMVIFVQHQPDAQAGMIYIWVYCCPVLAGFTVLVSAMTIKDYLRSDLEEESEG